MIVAQKNHHTKFFQSGSPDNVPPGKALISGCHILLDSLRYLLTSCKFVFAGTIIDNKVCHPRSNDFYLCAHAGMIVSITWYSFECLWIVLLPIFLWGNNFSPSVNNIWKFDLSWYILGLLMISTSNLPFVIFKYCRAVSLAIHLNAPYVQFVSTLRHHISI